MADGLSQGDLATLSLLDPHQGVCPNGHGCRLDPEPGFRKCDVCDYRGWALICWEITSAMIEEARRLGAKERVCAWAESFRQETTRGA